MATTAELTRTVDTLTERVTNHIKFFWTVIAFIVLWLGWLSYQLYNINGDVKQLLQPHLIEKAAAAPTDPRNQSNVRRILAETKKSQNPIPPAVLASTAHSFVAAAEKDEGAWKTVEELMEYRTYVNSLTFVFPPTNTPTEETKYEIKSVPGKPAPQMLVIPHGTPVIGAARLQAIGKSINPNVKLAPTNLVVLGGAATFDNMDIAHVVFVGVEIHYSGGDLHIEDASFVNCTFVFDNVDRSRMLAESIIASRNVNFQS